MNSFVLGATQGEQLTVSVISYERPASGEFHDDNWLSCEVHIHVGAFEGKYSANFLTSELHGLHNDLEHLYQDLKGSVAFEPMDSQLELKFSCNNLGRIHVSGIAVDQAGVGHALHFTLSLDQTDLARSVHGLREIAHAFPTRT